MEYAQNDLKIRPTNIDANELVAWLFFLKKDYTNAKLYADAMLSTNTKNANTLYKAAIIYAAAGDTGKGAELKTQAVAINTNIDPLVAKM